MSKKIFMVILTGVFVLAINNISFAMMCGEGRHQQTAQAESSEHKHTESEAPTLTSEEAVNVGNKICPVSGEKIDEKMKTTYEYEGKIYNFCCAMCIDEFKKGPDRYIKKVGEELQATAKEEQGATSPSKTNEGMHEESHHIH